ncbi:MAG: NUDIX domain-containing protein [Propionibacteriaceae bacterium]|nr:NUDIX domain-containing protein [Propionibacteriaceae bacterium]
MSEHTNPSPARVTDAIALLEQWNAPSSLVGNREEYVAFLRAGGASALERNGGPAHLTASCFIFTPALTHVLLCFHRKGQFWVQVGGHIDAEDDGVVTAALREAREESGLRGLAVVDGVLDLDTHDLAAAFGRCRTHWDVGIAALSPLSPPEVSDESEHVAWFPVDALPDRMAGSVSRRIATMLDQLRDETTSGLCVVDFER